MRVLHAAQGQQSKREMRKQEWRKRDRAAAVRESASQSHGPSAGVEERIDLHAHHEDQQQVEVGVREYLRIALPLGCMAYRVG